MRIRLRQEQYQAEQQRLSERTSLEIYRDTIPSVVQKYQAEARWYRTVHNRLQDTVIILSITLTTIVNIVGIPRWVIAIMSAIVGIVTGFMGYFKYRERSVSLQQTADELEHEYEAALLSIGTYNDHAPDKDSEKILRTFAARAEIIKQERRKRQLQLEQPPDVKSGQN